MLFPTHLLASATKHKPLRLLLSTAMITLTTSMNLPADEPKPTRPLRELNKDYFPFTPVRNAGEWKARREEIKQRILVAAGLYPLPEKTPLSPVMHSRIELDDYTVDKVFFESLPGHFVTGNLYLPKDIRGKIPAILCPHGHWNNGRFVDQKEADVKRELESGAEKFTNGARSPMQARCVHLARMGCAAFLYDMVGYADSVQFTEHRHGPAARGFVSADAELNLVSYFGLQTWNSLRAVDFMAGLPFVDTARIGCTGESGGGTQTMMVTALDDRIKAAFPCVMVSTAMQGGCTCENASYLRVSQGNIDIAAATAPRPLGMTAADDWTKELEAKGFPDLKNLYTMLGVPNRVEAHFNIKFPHNYNGVSRAQMNIFFNKYLKLGLTDFAERNFRFLPPSETSVWNEAHPKPKGDQVGEPHEVGIVNWFKQQSEKRLEPLLLPRSKSELNGSRKFFSEAWGVMIGRQLPKPGATQLTVRQQETKADNLLVRGTAALGGETVEAVFLYPKQWNRDTVLWLSLKGADSVLQTTGEPTENAQSLLHRGFAIACPTLYLPGATRNPNVYADGKRKVSTSYEGFAAYHYGYNPTLFAERVRDALTMVATLRDDGDHRSRKLRIAGVEGAGVIALAVTALAGKTVSQLACDTEGFRFAKLDHVWDVNFVPGAAKYGDVPALLALCAPTPTTVAGETFRSAPAAEVAFAVAKGKLHFADSATTASNRRLVNALTGE